MPEYSRHAFPDLSCLQVSLIDYLTYTFPDGMSKLEIVVMCSCDLLWLLLCIDRWTDEGSFSIYSFLPRRHGIEIGPGPCIVCDAGMKVSLSECGHLPYPFSLYMWLVYNTVCIQLGFQPVCQQSYHYHACYWHSPAEPDQTCNHINQLQQSVCNVLLPHLEARRLVQVFF